MSDDIFAPIEDDGWNTDERCPWCKADIEEAWRHADRTFECEACGQTVECEEWTQFVLKRPRDARAVKTGAYRDGDAA